MGKFGLKIETPKVSGVPKSTVGKMGIAATTVTGVSSKKTSGSFSNKPGKGFGGASKQGGFAYKPPTDQSGSLQNQEQPEDPFTTLMKQASKNARFSAPQYGKEE